MFFFFNIKKHEYHFRKKTVNLLVKDEYIYSRQTTISLKQN